MDWWETNLTEEPISQKNDETAHVLWFGIELFKILEFFWFLLEAMISPRLPTVLQCESCQFLDRFSCSVSLENIKMCVAFSLVWNNNFFQDIVLLPEVLLVMVFRKKKKKKQTPPNQNIF